METNRHVNSLVRAAIAIVLLHPMIAAAQDEVRTPKTFRLGNASLALTTQTVFFVDEITQRRLHDDAGSAIEALYNIAESGRAKLVLLGDALQNVAREELPARVRQLIAAHARPGDTIVLVGDHSIFPMFNCQVQLLDVPTDYFYGDLDDDGIVESPVVRMVAPPRLAADLLAEPLTQSWKVSIVCSQDCTTHLEAHRFATLLSRLGCDVRFHRGAERSALAAGGAIVHFGPGGRDDLREQNGRRLVQTGQVPALPLQPVWFAFGDSTVAPGSRLVREILENGARAVVGNTAKTDTAVPARFANQFILQLADAIEANPDLTLAQHLALVRAAYVAAHPGLAKALRQASHPPRQTIFGIAGEQAAGLLGWNIIGSPWATVPQKQENARDLTRVLRPWAVPQKIGRIKKTRTIEYNAFKPGEQAILALEAGWDKGAGQEQAVEIHVDGRRIEVLAERSTTSYRLRGSKCLGGYGEGEAYRAFALLPLPSPGKHTVKIALADGMANAHIAPSTAVEFWPSAGSPLGGWNNRIGAGEIHRFRILGPNDDESEIVRVRRGDLVETIGRHHFRVIRGVDFAGAEPGPLSEHERKAAVDLMPIDDGRYQCVILDKACNRPHDSMEVGGGDNASFATWFRENLVRHDGVPFAVKRADDDVVVSPDNGQNRFRLTGFETTARRIHLLVHGYCYPTQPVPVAIHYADRSSEKMTFPIHEWTWAHGNVAFDFSNTVSHFRHAAMTHVTLDLAKPDLALKWFDSLHGRYGLIAMTLEK